MSSGVTKIEFAKTIKLIQNFQSHQDNLNRLINILTDSKSIAIIGDELILELIKLLNKILNIKDEGLLYWWLYESEDRVIYLHDKDIELGLSTPEELYNFIIGQNREEN